MSNKELQLQTNQLLIFKTDVHGKLIYCNHEFLKVTGYNQTELLGESIQVLNHSDMPHGIEHLLWDTLKTKNEFHYFFKIITKQAKSCWTFAKITPFNIGSSTLLGYNCILREASYAAITMFSMYYEQMRDRESNQTSDLAAQTSLDLLTSLISATGDDYEACVFKLQFS